jgi:hypothetical protein
MNGIHDMGGLHGFGRVEVEANEPVFHARWEARVFGMVQSLPGGNIDAGRHSLERLDPVAYLRNGYYGRWLAAMERSLIAFGVVTEDDIRARMRGRRRRSKAIRPVRNESSTAWQREPVASYARQVDRPPLFRGGQAVRTRNHQPAGHTRLPAYGRGENPQYLYTVRFDGRELWGGSAEPATVVHLDLFEPYLEPA